MLRMELALSFDKTIVFQSMQLFWEHSNISSARADSAVPTLGRETLETLGRGGAHRTNFRGQHTCIRPDGEKKLIKLYNHYCSLYFVQKRQFLIFLT